MFSWENVSLSLALSVPPSLVTIQGPDTGLVGDSLTFRCLVNNANPAPDVQWVVNGRQVRQKNALLNLSRSFIRVNMLISEFLLIDGILAAYFVHCWFVLQKRFVFEDSLPPLSVSPASMSRSK